MSSERGKPYSRFSSQSRRYVKSPGNRGVGVSQHEAALEWGVHQRVLWELEHEGKLLGIRIGNRVWYSRAQLTELLGPAPVGGRQPSLFEFTDDVLSA